jgi:uncharacterized protein (DUF1810 family)
MLCNYSRYKTAPVRPSRPAREPDRGSPVPSAAVLRGRILPIPAGITEKPMSEPADDPHDLGRFVAAQRDVYDTALAELRAGGKRGHWMWFVFPQIAGLGRSPMAQRYAIGSLAEARAYLAHPLLGPRLRACTRAANGHPGLPARTLFGSPDDVKFRSSMTLFERAGPDEPVFREALETFFGGEPDPLTLARLGDA